LIIICVIFIALIGFFTSGKRDVQFRVTGVVSTPYADVVAAGVVVSTALNVTPKTRFVLPTLPGDTFYNGVVELTVPIDFSLHNARF